LSIFEFWELEFAVSFTFDKNDTILKALIKTIALSPSHILIEASSKVHLIIFLVLYGLSLASLVDCTDLHFVEIDNKIIYVVP
jgi:hypothetical protein